MLLLKNRAEPPSEIRAAMKYIKILSLPTTKIGDRFGRQQESPQQQTHPAWVFEYSQR